MTADELRVSIWALLRDQLDVDARLQGKRIVVDTGLTPIIILVTTARDASS